MLVSNFNNAQNLQGTGTTIIRVSRGRGRIHLLRRGRGGSANQQQQQRGLTAALGLLSNGWVIIGNLPTVDGTPATVQPGNLSVLDSSGKLLATLGNVDGPWGMSVQDLGLPRAFVARY